MRMDKLTNSGNLRLPMKLPTTGIKIKFLRDCCLDKFCKSTLDPVMHVKLRDVNLHGQFKS